MSIGFLGIIGAALIASNQVPGIDGFAQRSDMIRIEHSAKSIEIRIVSADIYEARKEQCKAIEAHEDGSKPGPLRRLNALMADYQSMTGFAYRLPGCEEI